MKRLLNPGSIAVFGGSHAEELIRQCDRMSYKGEIWPVHPEKEEVLGRRVYRNVKDLPCSPDAAYIGVNRHLTIEIVRQLSAARAGGAVCYASGFTEAGAEGSMLSDELLAASGDMPLIGPNCYGLLNYLNGAMLWPDQQGGRRVEEGVAIITMSSNVGFNLTMQRRGLPVAYMISLGNRLKFDLSDAILTFAGQEEVSAIGLFLETIPDPRAFQAAVNIAREHGKPIVAMKAGRTDTARKMVISHTASIAGSDRLVSALFERAGVARADSLEDFIEALKVLHVLGPLDGGRVGALSTSGGDLILLADALGAGLSMPELSGKVRADLEGTVHERVVAANPLDYQMFNWNDEKQMARVFTAFMSEDFDIVLSLLDYPRADRCDPSGWSGAENAFVRAAQQTGTRAAVLATFSDTIPEAVAERLTGQGVAMLAGIDSGLAGIRAAVELGAAWKQPPGEALLRGFDLPADATFEVLDEARSKEVLASVGIPVPAGRVVRGPDEAVAAAKDIGYPVVVKALGIAHKTEVDGVRLNLGTADRVREAMEDISGLSATFLVEKMIEGVAAELIVGVTRDEQFGPYLLVGSGGILVEMMKDGVPILLPATREKVLDALNRLKCAALFKGFRGAPPADLDAAVDAVLKIAKMVEIDPSTIHELDVNPLMLLAEGKGAIAVDGLICKGA